MAHLDYVFPCSPNPQRGRGFLLGADGKSFAYCNGKSVILRDAADPAQCDVYSEHSYATTVARFSPNGEWVASGDASGVVRIWGRRAGNTLKLELKVLSGSVDDMQWSQDSQRIVVAGDGKGTQLVRAFMWDSGSSVGEFEGHSKRVLSCALRPARPLRIATCGEDFLVNFYEGPPFRFKASHREHSSFVNCVRYAPDGATFLTVGSDKNGFLFDGLSGEPVGALSKERAHSGSIYAASWSPDGQQVLTVSADKTAKTWEAGGGGSWECKTTFTFGSEPGVDQMQVACAWLAEHLITVSLNGDINYLSAAQPERPQRVLAGHSKYVVALAQHEPGGGGGPELYSASYDGVIVRWQPGRGSLGRVRGPGHGGPVKAMAVAGGELVTAGLDDTVRWSPLPAEQYGSDPPLSLPGQPCDLAVAADEPEVVLVPTSKGIVLVRSKVALSTTPVAYELSAAALSPDGSEAAVGGTDGKLRIYSIRGDTLTEEAVLEKHRGPITAVRYSPDGALLASGDQKPEAVVWDRSSREVKMKNMLYHTARINCLAWAPDSRRIATGSLDNSVIVWDVSKPASGRLTIRGAHPGGVTAVIFNGSTTLLSAGDDACIRSWTLQE